MILDYKSRDNTGNACKSEFSDITSTMTLNEKPSKPSIDTNPTGTICSVLPYSANIDWTSTANTEYIVQYRKDSGVWTDSPNSWLTSGTAADSIQLVTAGTYDFRLKSRDSLNTSCESDWSNITSSFILVSKPSKPVIDSVPSGGICSTYPYNLNISWTSTANTEYLVQYRKDSGVWTDSPNSWLAAGSSSDSFNFNADGDYTFRLISRDDTYSTCESDYSDISAVLTLVEEPAKPVIDTITTGVVCTTLPYSFNLAWTANVNFQYLVQYRKDSGVWTDSPNSWLAAGSSSDSFNISAAGNYEFRLKSRVNTSCESIWSDISAVLTLVEKPSAPNIDSSPTGNICSSLNYSTNITWTGDTNFQYLVQYRKDSGVWTDSPNGWLVAGASSDTFDLSSAGNYEFRLQSRDKNQTTCESDWSSITTSLNLVEKPSKPSITTSPTGNLCTTLPYTANISWTGDTNFQYLVQYRKDSGTWTDSPNSWLLAGASSDTISITTEGTYDFKLISRDAADNFCESEWSDVTATVSVYETPTKPVIDSNYTNPICANTYPYNLTVNWTSTANTEYIVQYRKDAGSWTDSPNGWLVAGSNSDSFNIETVGTDIGGFYELRLQSRNAGLASCVSPLSDLKSFTIILKPEQVTGSDITDDGGVNSDDDGNIIYNWNTLTNTNACTYEINMDNSADPTTVYKTGIIGTATNYNAQTDGKTALSLGNYKWKIRAKRTINTYDCYGDWSNPIDSFDVVCPAFSAPTNLSTHTGNCSGFSTTFSWDAVTNVEHLWVEFSYDNINWTGNPTGYNSTDLGASATDYGVVTFTEASTKQYIGESE